MSKILPAFYLSHGGGPWNHMSGTWRAMHQSLEASLKSLPKFLTATPDCIVMISAHWEESNFTIMTAQNPKMLYDYSGFPPETYSISYPAPGGTIILDQVTELLKKSKIPFSFNDQRGFDHGTFVPLQVAFPEA